MQSIANLLPAIDKTVIDPTNIELPEKIRSLITGSDFWRKAKANRYKMLVREGHLDGLLELAEIAQTKDKPSHWFARVASKARWQETLEFLAELRRIAADAREVAKRLPGIAQKVIFKACWKARRTVVREAVTAQETGRNAIKVLLLAGVEREGSAVNMQAYCSPITRYLSGIKLRTIKSRNYESYNCG